tara:strand:+ start:9914 stop:10093 length:180 start_codon:yes stop_codon:yes gene_type:complete
MPSKLINLMALFIVNVIIYLGAVIIIRYFFEGSLSDVVSFFEVLTLSLVVSIWLSVNKD